MQRLEATSSDDLKHDEGRQSCTDTKKAQEMFTQSSGKAVETMTVWAEANQRVLRELVELSAGAAKEGVRLYAELQQSGIEALREAQAVALRWQSELAGGAAGSARLVSPRPDRQRARHAEVVPHAGGQRAGRVTRTAERLQTSAEQAGKGIQESFTEAVTKLKDVYAA